MGTRGFMSVDNQVVVKSAKAGTAATGMSSTQEVGSDMTDGWITMKMKSTYTFQQRRRADISVNTD